MTVEFVLKSAYRKKLHEHYEIVLRVVVNKSSNKHNK